MQTRTSFNGGEQSVDAGARFDMDSFMRGCRRLENWDLSCIGGVSRRRGMRQFLSLEPSTENEIGERRSKLVPYIYSYSESSEERFLVAISPARVRVIDRAGNTVADFVAESYYLDNSVQTGNEWYIDMDTVHTQQCNALLIITSATNHPLQLRRDSVGNWSLTEYEFSSPPWRYEKEKRNEPIVVTASRDEGSMDIVYDVDFSQVSDANESSIVNTDLLRISFWVDQQEAKETGANVRAGLEERSTKPIATIKGTRFYVPSEIDVTYWICTQEWPSTVYAEGLELPSNYPDNFEKASNISSYTDAPVCWSVHDVTGTTIAKNKKFGIRSGYWEYYTCIKDFSESDLIDGMESYDDYPDFFVRGVAIGDPLACQGRWEFWCSGTWYGEYAVKRNYETNSLYADGWETAGRSKSYNESAENELITGDESAEACYLQLMLLKSRRISESGNVSGWPPDSCGNRLIVKGFQYSQTLKASVVLNSDDAVVSVDWFCPDKVQMDWFGQRTINVWSWQAFSERYGYPRLCSIYGQRLVFASTDAQPQTIWMSQTDDLSNFFITDNDDSAIALTLATTTQNPICWILERRDVLMLGTSDKEYIIKAYNDSAITKGSLRKTMHGNTGSSSCPALDADDKVLFVERGGGRVFQYGYNYESDGFRATDLTILAPHVLADNGGAIDSTYMQKPERIAIYVTDNGQVVLCSYQSSQSVNAWHRWVTDGTVLSACAMPDGNNNDRLFFLVERSVPDAEGTDGWITKKVLNIEVVDNDSAYVDNFGSDYTSVLVTNSMFNPIDPSGGSVVKKGLRREIAYNFVGDVPLGNMMFTSDGGENWARAPRYADVVPGGWHKIGTLNNWEYETAVGVKVWGDNPMKLLCLQG